MKKQRVCPVEHTRSLDNKFRRWFQNPQKILKPLIKEGMTVLDQGCGPGFFTIDIAQIVGKSGRVIAADLQEGMLQKIRTKIQGTNLEDRIVLHKCEEDKIGITEQVDFILAFYMLHEIPQQEMFFKEIQSILKTNGTLFVAEPPIHVSKQAFRQSIKIAEDTGLIACDGPKVRFSKTAIFKKVPPW